jgi:flagellar protein FliL
MAKAPTTPESPAPAAEAKPAAPKSSPMAFIAAMLILTGMGVGLGGLMGLQLMSHLERQSASESEKRVGQNGGHGQALKGRYPANAGLKPLAPIVTNLASPERTWIRLEASLVMEGEQSAEANALAALIAEDIVGFLRTVALAQVQGASGFQHLREDLNDRVRVRSGGKVRDLVVQSLIIE